jgi:hypothetical protein
MHQFGLNLASIQWVQAGVNRPGRIEKVEVRLPLGLTLTRRTDATLSDMLVSGEVDAVMSARAPECFDQGHPNIRRLFEAGLLQLKFPAAAVTCRRGLFCATQSRNRLSGVHPMMVSYWPMGPKALNERRPHEVSHTIDARLPW